jgi:aminomethyltransferase
MDESISPLEAGLGWTVDLSGAREFVGRTALERAKAAGGLRRMVGLRLLDKGVLRAHQAVSTPHGAGEITSGTFSPTLQVSIALARVPGAVALGDLLQVDLRGRPAQVQVVKYPFVRHGKALI